MNPVTGENLATSNAVDGGHPCQLFKQNRVILVFSGALIFVLLFIGLYQMTSSNLVGVVGLLPVILAGWCFGKRTWMTMGVINTVLIIALFYWIARMDPLAAIGFGMIYAVIFLLAAELAGWANGFWTKVKQNERTIAANKNSLEQQVKQRTNKIQVLYELSQRIGYTLDYVELFSIIQSSLGQIVDYDISASLALSPVVDCQSDGIMTYFLPRPVAPALLNEAQKI